MKKLLMVLAISLLMLSMITSEASAQCEGTECTDVKIENNIDHSQAFGYYNNSQSASFPIPHSPHRVMLPIYYNDPGTHNSNYIQILSIIQFQDTFSYQDLKALVGDGDVDLMVNSHKDELADSQKQTHITIMFPVQNVPVPRGVFIGHISGEANDTETTTMSCLAKAAMEAMNRGANILYITNQGALRILKAFGWGIGFSHTKASLDGDMEGGNTSSAGFGLSGGSSRYEEEPFIQTVALYVAPTEIQARRKAIEKAAAALISQNASAQVNDTRLSVKDSVERSQ